jgi:hypothetical protein
MSKKRKAELRKERQALNRRIERRRTECEAKEEFVEQYEKKYGPLDAEKLMAIKSKQRAMRSYMFEARQLGWFNVDKFLDFPEEKLTRLEIENQPGLSTDVYVVFEDRKTVMNAYIQKEHYVVPRIPENEKICIVGIKVFHERKAMLAEESLVTGEENQFTLDFEEYEVDEVKERLMKMDQ